MIYYLYYPLLEVGINSYIQYQYYSDLTWLFPFYPLNHYKPLERFYYIFNFTLLTACIGYIFENMNMPELSLLTNIVNFLLLTILESAIVYYGHRYSHYNKFIFRNVHYFHHKYIAVKPFEGSCASPYDIVLFVCLILTLPFYTLPLSFPFYVLFTTMVIGTGILDHSGIEYSFLWYNSNYHKVHHIQMNKNYGFPMPIFDMLHGTHIEYRPRNNSSRNNDSQNNDTIETPT